MSFSDSFVSAIHLIQENVLAPISSAHHVTHGAGVFNPWFARHGLLLAFLPSKANAKTNHTMVWFYYLISA
jgi:hypothetical protein